MTTARTGESRSVESDAAIRSGRARAYRTKQGDLIGGFGKIAQGDFGRFLGYTPASDAELSGANPLSGARVVELSLQKSFNEVGENAMARGDKYRNHYISWGRYTNQPGREPALIRDAADAISQGVERRADGITRPMGAGATGQYMRVLQEYHERSKRDNMRYLEMQYKFLYASKSFGTISNMMKVRHEAILRAIRESR